jgi:hypothetical protein
VNHCMAFEPFGRMQCHWCKVTHSAVYSQSPDTVAQPQGYPVRQVQQHHRTVVHPTWTPPSRAEQVTPTGCAHCPVAYPEPYTWHRSPSAWSVNSRACVGVALARAWPQMAALKTEHFDVLVVGGGATGSGVALDCATRGLKVALVERDDFASGTSSRSTKLIHGGIRYLAQVFCSSCTPFPFRPLFWHSPGHRGLNIKTSSSAAIVSARTMLTPHPPSHHTTHTTQRHSSPRSRQSH